MRSEPCGVFFLCVSFYSGRAVVSAGLGGFIGQTCRKTKRAGGSDPARSLRLTTFFAFHDGPAYKDMQGANQAHCAHAGVYRLNRAANSGRCGFCRNTAYLLTALLCALLFIDVVKLGAIEREHHNKFILNIFFGCRSDPQPWLGRCSNHAPDRFLFNLHLNAKIRTDGLRSGSRYNPRLIFPSTIRLLSFAELV